jgi:NAD(P)-dependent dehydrogenase (short-subunit alcohol dehydrogenase family)
VPETTVVDPNSLTGNHRHRVADERRQGSRVVQSGVIVTLTAVPGRLPANLIGGQTPAWAALEAFSRSLALELGRRSP